MASWLSENVLDKRLTQSNKARIEINRQRIQKLQQLLYNNTPAAHDRNKNYNNCYITILQQHMTGTKTTTIII